MSRRPHPPLAPIATLVLSLGSPGCGGDGAALTHGDEPTRAAATSAGATTPADLDAALAARLTLVAQDFGAWAAEAAPAAAASSGGAGAGRPPAAPSVPGSGGPRPHVSRADAGSVAPELGPTHAGRLFFVHARNPSAYRGVGSGASQRDQVIVLEARAAVPFVMPGPGRAPGDVVRLAGQDVRPGPTEHLFVMMHDLSDGTEEAHWTYGVVLPDGTVQDAGRIASCIACHADAPHGGLFAVR